MCIYIFTVNYSVHKFCKVWHTKIKQYQFHQGQDVLCTFHPAALYFESLMFLLKGNFHPLTIVFISVRIEYACRLLVQKLNI